MTPRPAPSTLAETATAPRRRVLKTIAYVAPAVVAIGLTADRAFASGGPKIAAPVAKRQSQDRAPVKKK